MSETTRKKTAGIRCERNCGLEVLIGVEITGIMVLGHVSLPNGLGTDQPGGGRERVGVPVNELTSSSRRDLLAGRPWHKYVPARVEVKR